MRQFAVLLLCTFTICCFQAAEPVEVATPDEPSEPEQICLPDEGPYKIDSGERISVDNVSLSPAADWISDVEYAVIPRCVLVRNDYKPDRIGGRTLQIDMHYKASEDEARISVFKITEYKEAFAKFPQYVERG